MCLVDFIFVGVFLSAVGMYLCVFQALYDFVSSASPFSDDVPLWDLSHPSILGSLGHVDVPD